MQPDETRFMPSEGMITRPHDATWERLVRGQRVTVSHGDWSSAEMRVTDIIAHYDGGETYVLRDATVTEAELAAEKAAFAEAMAGLAFCGDLIAEGCEHRMTGGCLPGCFRGPCEWEPFCLGFPTVDDLDRYFPPQGMCGCGSDVRHKVLDGLCAEMADGKPAKKVAEEMGIEWAAAVAAYRVWDPERGSPKAGARYRDAEGKWRSVA